MIDVVTRNDSIKDMGEMANMNRACSMVLCLTLIA